jgi:hypothetical protein
MLFEGKHRFIEAVRKYAFENKIRLRGDGNSQQPGFVF